jgi:hypothetical protein
MPELDTRGLLDGGGLGAAHRLLCPECEDPFEYVHPVSVDVDRGGDVVNVDAAGVGFGTRPRTARGVIIRVDFVCERGHQFVLRFQFHKGQTFLGASALPPAAPDTQGVPDIRTIWRD